jgi:hypothetical protein
MAVCSRACEDSSGVPSFKVLLAVPSSGSAKFWIRSRRFR